MMQVPQLKRKKDHRHVWSNFSTGEGIAQSFRYLRPNQVAPDDASPSNHASGRSVTAGGEARRRSQADSEEAEAREADMGEVVGETRRRTLFGNIGGRGRTPSQHDNLAHEYRNALARGEAYSGGDGSKSPWQASRRFLYRLLDEPDSSPMASIIAWFIFSLILLSTATYCVETLPEIGQDCHAMSVIYWLDVTAVSVFTLEYALRWYASPSRLYFPFHLKNIIDILAIAPFYLSPLPPLCKDDVVEGRNSPLAVVDLRFLRLLRVFRTFKLSGYGPQLELVVSAVRESKEMLMMFMINLMIVIIVFSSITYFAERDHNEEFSSIPASCWWAIVTVLTVGYGDMAPTTVAGKLVASLLMVIALVVIALPVSIIGTNFTLEWERFKEEQKAVLRASKLPAKLKQAYPVLEMWMEDLNQHCYSLRKETSNMRKLSRKLRESLPENTVQLLEEVMKSAEAIKDLSNEDISASTAAIAKVLRRIQETQERLGALNTEAKSCLRQSVRAVQKSFSGAICQQALEGEQMGHLKDLRRFKGFVLINVIGCKGLPVNNTLADIPDAYVIFASGVESCQTSVVSNSASPYFDETLILLIEDPSIPVSIDVFDKEMFSKDEFLGAYKLQLPRASSTPGVPRDPQATWKPHTFKLEGSAKDCGSLMMQYAFYELSSLTEQQLANPELWPKLMQLTTSIDVPSIVNKDVLSEVAALMQGPAHPEEASREARHVSITEPVDVEHDGDDRHHRESASTCATETMNGGGGRPTLLLPSDTTLNDTFRSSVESPLPTPYQPFSRPLLGDTLHSNFNFPAYSQMNDTMGSQESIALMDVGTAGRHGSLTVTLPPLPGSRYSGSMAPTPEGEVAPMPADQPPLPGGMTPGVPPPGDRGGAVGERLASSSALGEGGRSASIDAVMASSSSEQDRPVVTIPRFNSVPSARFSQTLIPAVENDDASDTESSAPQPAPDE